MIINQGQPGELDTRDERTTTGLLDGLACIAWNWSMDGDWGEADWTDGDGAGAIRYGHHLLKWDNRGYVWTERYESAEAATEAAESDFPPEPDDEDGFIDYGPDLRARLGRDDLGPVDSVESGIRVISARMEQEGYYPDIWVTGEHGPLARPVTPAERDEAAKPPTCTICGIPLKWEVEEHWVGWVDPADGCELGYSPNLHNHTMKD